MKILNFILFALISYTMLSCATVTQPGATIAKPAFDVRLEITSLTATRVQEQGALGVEDGDELTMFYTINAYDSVGNLLSVNNGFWGTRTHQQGAVIAASEFDKIMVSVPENGKVIVAFSLIEIDDYKGERRIISAKRNTNNEIKVKRSDKSTLEEDQQLTPLEIVDQSMDIAGYGNLTSKHLKLSTNDNLGGTKKVFEASDLKRILNKEIYGTDTYQIDGSQVNENYLYELKYDIDVTRITGK